MKLHDVLIKKNKTIEFLSNNKNIYIPTKWYDRDNINDENGGGVIAINSEYDLVAIYQNHYREDAYEWCTFRDIYDLNEFYENDFLVETNIVGMRCQYRFGYKHDDNYSPISDLELFDSCVNNLVANYFSKKGFSHKEILWALFNCEDLNRDFSKTESTENFKIDDNGNIHNIEYRLSEFKSYKRTIRALEKIKNLYPSIHSIKADSDEFFLKDNIIRETYIDDDDTHKSFEYQIQEYHIRNICDAIRQGVNNEETYSAYEIIIEYNYTL
jgi:hypothetical protein